MKYIDSEKLIAEIERRLKSLHEWKIGWERRLPLSRNKTYYKHSGKESAYDAILNIITSLQREQSEVNLEKEIQTWCHNPLYELTEEQDTGKAPVKVLISDIEDTARHFYELGLRARKER